MRLGLYGLGAAARANHLPAIIATPGIELAAVAGPEGGLNGVPWYPSMEAMLAQELSIDAILICSPPLQRQEQAAIAVQAGRHVLLDRPPTATLTQAGTLLDSARRAGLTIMTAWPERLTPAVETARGLLQRDSLEATRLVWTEDSRAWPAENEWVWSPGGFGVFHTAIDGLSIVNHLSKERLAVVEATLHIAPDRDEPVAAELTLRGESGSIVEAIFDVRPGAPRQRTVELRTRRATMLLDQHAATLMHDGRSVPLESANPYFATYRKFHALVEAGMCDVDTAPLRQVADAHLIGQRVPAEAFDAP